MMISVVIPTCDRPDALAECLLRLSPELQGLPADEFEIIVTDDGSRSPAEPALAARFPSVRWTPGPRRGPAANRNHGADLSRGELIVFLDDDCLPGPGLLAAYARHFAAPEAAAAEGGISADRPRARLDEEAPINETGGHFWSCNIAVRAGLFRKLGGFDERFPHAAMEDVELRSRLRLRRVAIAFVPEASVVHPLRRSKGWRAVRASALSHATYRRMETCHLAHPSYRAALRRFLRAWVKHILPGLWRYHGRGFASAAARSLHPFLAAREMKRARTLPRLQAWTPEQRAQRPPGPAS